MYDFFFTLLFVNNKLLYFASMDLDPTIRHTFWSIVIGSYLHGVAGSSVSQITVQRYLAISDLKKANM